MRNRGLALAIPALVLVVAGCSATASTSPSGNMHGSEGHGSQNSSSMGGSPSASDVDSQTSGDDHSAMDLMFAQMMIPHHMQAVEMSTLAETRASSPFIKDLAARIKSEQAPEIELMSGWLTAWGAPTLSPGDMDHMDHMGSGMSGMLTDAQLAELEQASGAGFDRLYAALMIAHHEGAIQMTRMIEDSANPEVAALAVAIVASQTAEIAEMQDFLAQQ